MPRLLHHRSSRVLTLLLAALFLLACSTTAESPPDTYDDPFAYCAAIDTVDAPDARYVGPFNPPSIVTGTADAISSASDSEFRLHPPAIQWRCMDGQLLACAPGNNLPCGAGSDSRQPTTEMNQYCNEHPDAEAIPVSVDGARLGHPTVYIWKCTQRAPTVASQELELDPRGFITRYWFEIAAP